MGDTGKKQENRQAVPWPSPFQRPEAHIEWVCAALEAEWKKRPELRLAQLVDHANYLRGAAADDLWLMWDERLLAALQKETREKDTP